MNIKNKRVVLKNKVLLCSQIDLCTNESVVEDYILVEPLRINGNFSEVAGVSVVVTFKDFVYVIKTQRPGYPDTNSEYIELPRGFIDKNETIFDAARREAEEELGYHLIVDNCELIQLVSPEPGVIGGLNALVRLNLSQEINLFDCENYISLEKDIGICSVEKLDLSFSLLKKFTEEKLLLDAITIIGLQHVLLSNIA